MAGKGKDSPEVVLEADDVTVLRTTVKAPKDAELPRLQVVLEMACTARHLTALNRLINTGASLRLAATGEMGNGEDGDE